MTLWGFSAERKEVNATKSYQESQSRSLLHLINSDKLSQGQSTECRGVYQSWSCGKGALDSATGIQGHRILRQQDPFLLKTMLVNCFLKDKLKVSPSETSKVTKKLNKTVSLAGLPSHLISFLFKYLPDQYVERKGIILANKSFWHLLDGSVELRASDVLNILECSTTRMEKVWVPFFKQVRHLRLIGHQVAPSSLKSSSGLSCFTRPSTGRGLESCTSCCKIMRDHRNDTYLSASVPRQRHTTACQSGFGGQSPPKSNCTLFSSYWWLQRKTQSGADIERLKMIRHSLGANLTTLCVIGTESPNQTDPLTVELTRLLVGYRGVELESLHLSSFHLPIEGGARGFNPKPLIVARAKLLRCDNHVDTYLLRCPGVETAYVELHNTTIARILKSSDTTNFNQQQTDIAGAGWQDSALHLSWAHGPPVSVDNTEFLTSFTDRLKSIHMGFDDLGGACCDALQVLARNRARQSVPLECVGLASVSFENLKKVFDALPPTRRLDICVTEYYVHGLADMLLVLKQYLERTGGRPRQHHYAGGSTKAQYSPSFYLTPFYIRPPTSTVSEVLVPLASSAFPFLASASPTSSSLASPSPSVAPSPVSRVASLANSEVVSTQDMGSTEERLPTEQNVPTLRDTRQEDSASFERVDDESSDMCEDLHQPQLSKQRDGSPSAVSLPFIPPPFSSAEAEGLPHTTEATLNYCRSAGHGGNVGEGAQRTGGRINRGFEFDEDKCILENFSSPPVLHELCINALMTELFQFRQKLLPLMKEFGFYETGRLPASVQRRFRHPLAHFQRLNPF